MDCADLITLQLHSNIDEYELTIYGCDTTVRQTVSARYGTLCFRTCSPYLRIVATPRTSGYSNRLYFGIDISCACCARLHLHFSATPTSPPTTTVNTFTLTDSTYGLPIDGTLTFTQI